MNIFVSVRDVYPHLSAVNTDILNKALGGIENIIRSAL
jgi:hypothetical protein